MVSGRWGLRSKSPLMSEIVDCQGLFNLSDLKISIKQKGTVRYFLRLKKGKARINIKPRTNLKGVLVPIMAMRRWSGKPKIRRIRRKL